VGIGAQSPAVPAAVSVLLIARFGGYPATAVAISAACEEDTGLLPDRAKLDHIGSKADALGWRLTNATRHGAS